MTQYRIMLLDTEEDNIGPLKAELAIAGYRHVEVFTEAEQALERFKNEKFHIVILDTLLGESDGIEVIKIMKGYDSLTQFIVIPQHFTLSSILSCLELGVNDYITKPFKNINDVLDVVQLTIGNIEKWKTAMKESVNK